MLDLFYIQEVNQAAALFQPLRVELMKLMAEPRTCAEMGQVVGESPQKVYYHVKILENAGLVEKVREERVRGIPQGYYQAKARSYWLSPAIVGRLGGRQKAQEQVSLNYLLALAEGLQADVASLAQSQSDETPSLGLAAKIELRDGNERAAFMQEVQTFFQALAEKYGKQAAAIDDQTPSTTFKLMLACYPQPLAESATGN